MALGILEPPVEHVPGTVYVYAAQQRQTALLDSAQHLKRDKTGKIILVPQPSADPNDPLVRAVHVLQSSLHDMLICSRTGHYGSVILSSPSSASFPVSQRPHPPFSQQIRRPLQLFSRERSRMRRY